MKKIIFNVGTLLMIIGVFSACDKKAVSFNENNEVEISEEKDRNNFVNSEDVNNEKDQTGTATESTNDNDAGIDINKFNNIEKISSECDYAISSDLQDMSSSAQEIVEGKIAEIKYVAIDGDPWTKISLQIQNCLSGSLNEGDVITLYQSGGYVPLSEHIKYYDDAFRYKDWSEDKINDTLIKEVIDGEQDAKVGDESIYFLTKFNKEGILNGNYGRVCGKYAKLDKAGTDSYMHKVMDSDKSEVVSISTIKSNIQ